MYPRYCQRKIIAAMHDTPVVIIAGPRQCGKTTLVKTMQKEDCQYITLDDQGHLIKITTFAAIWVTDTAADGDNRKRGV